MMKSISYWSMPGGLSGAYPICEALADAKCAGFEGLELAVAEAAVLANKHVFIEKPMARDVVQARQLMALAKTSKKHMMVGMCLRFWPGWQWLKEAIDSSVYGPLQALHCQRLSAFPGGDFYRSGARCGGALLDMHIHDTDFIRYCLGRPSAVFPVAMPVFLGPRIML